MGKVTKYETGALDPLRHQLDEHPVAFFSWCVFAGLMFILGTAVG